MDVIDHHNHLIKEAEDCLSRIQTDLASIVDGPLPVSKDSPESEMENLRMLQLVLQFRLDTQDVLQRLFQFSQSLWQVLGVSSQYSSSMNLERLSFALGGEDLHHALSMLNRLIDALLRLLQRYHLDQVAESQTLAKRKQPVMKPPVNTSRLYPKLVRMVDNQKSFAFILNQLAMTLEDSIEGQPMVGPMLDHICKLEGPISRFYRALQNGLVLSGSIYQQLEIACHLTQTLDGLINQTNLVLSQSQQRLEKPRMYQPTKNLSSSQELEARATEKRLGYFFRPYWAG